MKDEDEVIRKLLVPIIKEEYFVKAFVRVDKLHQKLKTEGYLSPEEESIKHPFHPDIDVLYWSKQYTQEPEIFAAEVKYFRLKDGNVYPTIYEGLGEAMMLLTFGLNYVSLWHLFDPEIPSETVNRYRDLTQNLISDTSSPINYQSWLLPEIPKEISVEQDPQSTALKQVVQSIYSLKVSSFLISVTLGLKTNPLMNRWDTKIMRAIIKKYYRMVK
jgi:hypothetical protein